MRTNIIEMAGRGLGEYILESVLRTSEEVNKSEERKMCLRNYVRMGWREELGRVYILEGMLMDGVWKGWRGERRTGHLLESV